MKKYILVLFFIQIAVFSIIGNNAMVTSKNDNVFELNQKKVKKVLLFCDSQYPKWGYLSWFLYDPLIISNAAIEVKKVFTDKEKSIYPDLTSENISSYDLVIVPYPHQIKPEYVNGLLSYLENKGSLLLVEPMFDSSTQSSLFMEKLGITFKGSENKTPVFSVLTDALSNRILGFPEGTSVYPHRTFQPYLKFDEGKSIVITRLGYKGDPDLFVTNNGRVGIVATDILGDLEAHHRGSPEYSEYKKNIGYLFVNTIRTLLGLGYFNQPVQTPLQKWGDMFYAYAAAKEYVLLAQEEESFSKKLSADELLVMIDKADNEIRQSAQFIIQGKFNEAKNKYDSGVKILSGCMDKMTSLERYIIRGWHASILTPDYYGGGLLGYAESEWQDHLLQWMGKQMDWIKRSGSKRIIDVYPCDWELLNKYYVDEIKLFREGIKDGYLEAVHGIYTAAYLPVLSEESNIRQFSYGLKGFDEVLGAKVETYVDPRDHFDFHPQLPQLLNSFGYKYAILHSNQLGEITKIKKDKIKWRGLDGSEIEAVPQYEGIDKPLYLSHPENIAKADSLGYKVILLGDAVDATADFPGEKFPSEKEHTLINPIAPIVGTWVTAKEFFEKTSNAKESIYLNTDDLWASNIDLWSSWGCMNEAYDWNRETENKILAAEKLSVVASFLDKMTLKDLTTTQKKIDNSWTSLLRTQDHMTFGSVDYSDQVPPSVLEQEEENKGKHSWGYDFELLPRNLNTVGGMENYAEAGTDNYAGPMIPGSRYNRVKKFYNESQSIADTILNKALEEIPVIDFAKRDSGFIPFIVFNQLGRNKKDFATIEKNFNRGEVFQFSLSDGKKDIPYQIVAETKHEDNSLKMIKVIFLADIPSLGFKIFYLKPAIKSAIPIERTSLRASSTSLENDYYLVEINPKNGGIERIFDKKLGLEMLDSKQSGNELFSPSEPSISSNAGRANATLIEKGPLRATILIKSKIGETPYSCLISLYNGIKRIDFDLSVDYGKGGTNFGSFKEKETGLFVRFPLSYTGNLYINQPFGLYEAKKERQVTLDFADLYQGQYGLSIIHRNSPSYHYKEGILSICLTRGRPYVVGEQSYKYSIYTHEDDPFEGSVYNIAKETNTPFITHWLKNDYRKLYEEFSFLSIEKPNIVLSALYSNGNKIYARFYERSGKETKTSIKMPYLKSAECHQIKLNNEVIREVQNNNNEIILDFKPWEVITVAINDIQQN